MLTHSTEQKIYYTLRIAVAMCFIGHGAFGIITKQIWCNYFGVFGIGTEAAYRLMPPVGIFDIVLGLIILIYPARMIAVWLVFWGIFTALLRPLSGESFAEVIERAGNYGAPLVLLLLTGFPSSFKDLFSPMKVSLAEDAKRTQLITTALRLVVFLLLAGHGWLNLMEKKGLVEQYSSLGFAAPATIAKITGVAEILAALAVLIRPVAPLLLILFVWKMASELLYPHYMAFEWIERGGSYGSILALWLALRTSSSFSKENLRKDEPVLRNG